MRFHKSTNTKGKAMSYAVFNTKDAKVATVDATEEDFAIDLPANTGSIDALYELCSSTACWYKQGRARKLTFPTFANCVDGDYFTIEVDGVSVVYEIDKSGNGVTAGRVAVNIVGDTTAAEVAADAVTAITGAQPALALTDNLDGTIEVVATGSRMNITENVSHGSFAIASSTALIATAGANSKFLPAGKQEWISPKYGQNISILRDAADGKASLTGPVRWVR